MPFSLLTQRLPCFCLILLSLAGSISAASISTKQPSHASADRFKDLPRGHWASKAVRELARRNILKGTVRDHFSGDRPVTRYELALALYRMVQYLEIQNGRSSRHDPIQPANWLVAHGYLTSDTPLAQAPSTSSVSPGLLSDSLAYVSDRILLHRAPPGERNEE